MFMLMAIESARIGSWSANRSGIFGFPMLATLQFIQHIKRYDKRMSNEEMHRKAKVHKLLYRREQHLML